MPRFDVSPDVSVGPFITYYVASQDQNRRSVDPREFPRGYMAIQLPVFRDHATGQRYIEAENPATINGLLEMIGQPPQPPVIEHATFKYNFTVPQGQPVPSAGAASQSGQNPRYVLFSKGALDGNAGPVLEYIALNPTGWMVMTGAIMWTIAAAVDYGTYVRFDVTPTDKATPGLLSFVFHSEAHH